MPGFKGLWLVCAAAVLAFEPLSAVAQDPAAQPLEFEAASIHPSTDKSVRGSEGGPGSKSPTFYRFERASLLDLVAAAWNLDYFQVIGPSALDRDAFDVSARLPQGATKEQFHTMLQNLLVERFALKAHTETREFSAYALVVSESGLKIKPAVAEESPAPAPQSDSGPDWPQLPLKRPNVIRQFFNTAGGSVVHLTVYMEPMSVIALSLPRTDDMVSVDRTGLTGSYTFRLEYALGDGPDETPSGIPDIFTALKQQLGLERIRAKVPFPVIVVESIHRMPTEN